MLGLIKLQIEELHDLYSSSNGIRVNKSRRITLVGACGTCGGEEKCIQDFGSDT
jgi:hypothetical protein